MLFLMDRLFPKFNVNQYRNELFELAALPALERQLYLLKYEFKRDFWNDWVEVLQSIPSIAFTLITFFFGVISTIYITVFQLDAKTTSKSDTLLEVDMTYMGHYIGYCIVIAAISLMSYITLNIICRRFRAQYNRRISHLKFLLEYKPTDNPGTISNQ